MIYDVASPQFQQFLTKNRKAENNIVKAKTQANKGKQKMHKPAGAASTGL